MWESRAESILLVAALRHRAKSGSVGRSHESEGGDAKPESCVSLKETYGGALYRPSCFLSSPGGCPIVHQAAAFQLGGRVATLFGTRTPPAPPALPIPACRYHPTPTTLSHVSIPYCQLTRLPCIRDNLNHSSQHYNTLIWIVRMAGICNHNIHRLA